MKELVLLEPSGCVFADEGTRALGAEWLCFSSEKSWRHWWRTITG